LGTVLADRERIPLHHPKGKRNQAVNLPNVSGRQKSEGARETRKNAERERTVNHAVMLSGALQRNAKHEAFPTSLIYFRRTIQN
jgi:hypothetical protein